MATKLFLIKELEKKRNSFYNNRVEDHQIFFLLNWYKILIMSNPLVSLKKGNKKPPLFLPEVTTPRNFQSKDNSTSPKDVDARLIETIEELTEEAMILRSEIAYLRENTFIEVDN